MSLRRIVHAAWLVLACALPLSAQRIATQVNPQQAFLGQTIHYYVQAQDAKTAECELPRVDGLEFELEDQGITDQQTRVSIINGRRNVRETSNYTFVFKVIAERPGHFVIPSPRVTVAGSGGTGGEQLLIVEDPASDDRARLEFRAEPPSIVMGQQGRLIVDVFLKRPPSQVNATDPLDLFDRGSGLFDQGTAPPVLDLPWLTSPPQGLGPIDLQAWVNARQQRRGFQFAGVRGGRFLEGQPIDVKPAAAEGADSQYRRYRFTFPIRGEVAGPYEFAPVTLQGQLVAATGSRLVWRDAFARSQPLRLDVLEPPLEGRPASFSGAVGSFTFELQPPTPTKVHVGDAVYLTLVVRGSGFLKGVGLDLAAQLGPQFRVETVGVTDSLPAGATKPPGFPDRSGLWRQFDFKVYPQSASVSAIGELAFSWYDPEKRTYVTANTPATPITVDAAAASSDVLVARNGSATRSDIELVPTSALSGNVTDLNLLADQAPRPWAWIALLLALPFLYCGIAFGVGRARRLREDPALARRRRAVSRLRTRLREARSLAGSAAISSAHAALCGYVADLDNGDEDAMTSADLLRWMEAQVQDPGLRTQVRQLSDAVEAASYGGGAASHDSALLEGLEHIATRKARLRASVVLAIGLCASFASAQDVQTFTEAQAAFESRDFAAAARSYQRMLSADYENGYVLYNLGNAYLRAGKLGNAIAAYRRATLFLPGDANLEVNLRRALEARRDPLSPPEHREVLDYVLFWRRQLPFGTQLQLAVGLGIAAFGLALLRLLTARRLPAVKAGVVLLAAASALFTTSTVLEGSRIAAGDRAVVIEDGTMLRTGPSASFDPRYEQPLGEGAELQVQDRRDGWLRVLAGGKYEGWLPETSAVIW